LDYFVESFRPVPRLSQRFFDAARLKPRGRDDQLSDRHRNLASSVQTHVENVLCEIANSQRKRTGEDSLYLSVGLGVNSLVNAAVEQRAGFKRIFVQPAAGNAGCSIGAALYTWHQTLGNSDRVYQMEHAFLGPRFDDDAIKRVLDNCKISYEYFLTED